MLPDDKPKLRPLEVRRVRHDGAPYFMVRDPQRIAEHALYIPEHFGPILAMLDGERTPQEIVRSLEEEWRVRVPPDLIQQVVGVLDDALLLESARFDEAYAAELDAFHNADFRSPALAGLGYPEEAQALWSLLQEYLEQCDGIEPAAVDWQAGAGLLSPHIDYERGGSIYAGAWKRAATAAAEAEIVVIFGTDHHGDDPFTLTRQNYATPYGILPTSRSIVDALAEEIGGEAAFAGELRHRGEHSLELVLTWLHHMRAGAAVEVVPILCGSLHRYMLDGESPADDALIERVLRRLREETRGRRVLVIASGDLAHVGSAFGQPPLSEGDLRRVCVADARIGKALATGDADGFFGEIKAVQNRNNVCGVTPIYLSLRMLGALPGEALGYRICPADEDGTSVVTVAGVMFHAGAEPRALLGQPGG